eukprot:COSAG01_NODE_62997_length_282_cov_0.289617_1_plen_53_part_10
MCNCRPEMGRFSLRGWAAGPWSTIIGVGQRTDSVVLVVVVVVAAAAAAAAARA